MIRKLHGGNKIDEKLFVNCTHKVIKVRLLSDYVLQLSKKKLSRLLRMRARWRQLRGIATEAPSENLLYGRPELEYWIS